MIPQLWRILKVIWIEISACWYVVSHDTLIASSNGVVYWCGFNLTLRRAGWLSIFFDVREHRKHRPVTGRCHAVSWLIACATSAPCHIPSQGIDLMLRLEWCQYRRNPNDLGLGTVQRQSNSHLATALHWLPCGTSCRVALDVLTQF